MSDTPDALPTITFNQTQANFRAVRYRIELDPLAMKMLRGDTNADGTPITTQQLINIAEGIKSRFPYSFYVAPETP